MATVGAVTHRPIGPKPKVAHLSYGSVDIPRGGFPMRYHITIYDTDHGEPALSQWVAARSTPKAAHAAIDLYQVHRGTHGSACTLNRYVVSKRVASVEPLQVCDYGSVDNGQTSGATPGSDLLGH